jgi:hypothetical protein
VSSAVISVVTPASKSSSSRSEIQLIDATDSGRGPVTSRRSSGTIRLPFAAAWSSSCRQTFDTTESGEMTNTNVSAPSIAERISAHPLGAGRDALPVHPGLPAPGHQRVAQAAHERLILPGVRDEQVGHGSTAHLRDGRPTEQYVRLAQHDDARPFAGRRG